MRMLRKMERIVRDKMNAIGGQDIFRSGVAPSLVVRGDQSLDGVRGRCSARGTSTGRTKTSVAAVSDSDKASRRNPQPRAGDLPDHKVVMEDTYSFDVDDPGLEDAYHTARRSVAIRRAAEPVHDTPVIPTISTLKGSANCRAWNATGQRA
jgi:prolyl-tRNA synthetase